jgi:hypothetical protein
MLSRLRNTGSEELACVLLMIQILSTKSAACSAIEDDEQ